MTDQPTERIIETSFAIDAPAGDVWRALTDADWLTNWFPVVAKVTPGKGGSIWSAWDKNSQFTTPIAEWDENRRLKLIYVEATPPDQVEEARAKGMYLPFQVSVDYLLEDRGGSTTLRLVHSGFSDEPVWDAQYDGTVRGWQFELRGLKHFLEKHRGVSRHVVSARHDLTGVSLDEAWRLLFSAEGLCAEGGVDDCRPGDRYSLRTSAGDAMEGEVYIIRPPQDLCATVENLNHALLRIRIDEPCFTAPKQEVHFFLSTFGLPDEQAAALKANAQSMLDALYGDLVQSPA